MSISRSPTPIDVTGIAFAGFVLVVGFAASLLAGIAGVGAVLLIAPLLYFGAPFFGVTLDFKAISNLTTFAVVVAALRSILIYRGFGLVRRDVVAPLLLPSLIGACVGVITAKFVTSGVVQVVFAVTSIAGALILLIPYHPDLDELDRPLHVRPLLYATLSGTVGIVGGLAGAGGGFLLVPVLLTIFRLPTRIALSSAAISGTIIAIAAFIGRVALVSLDWRLLAAIGVGAYLGAEYGTRLQFRYAPIVIRRTLAIVVGVSALRLLIGLRA